MIGLRGMVGVAAVSVGALAPSFVAGPVAQAKPTCAPAHSRTLASDSFARVYGRQGKAYACLRSNGKTRLLKGASPKCQMGPNVYICDRFALGGKWVAWTKKNPSDVDIIGPNLTVMYVPTGAVNHHWYPTRRLDGEVYKIAVLSDGAAAWTESESDGGGGAFAVGVFGADLRNHPIDRLDTCGASVNSQATCYISASSLRVLSGKTIAWTYAKDASQQPTITAKRTLY